VGVELQDEKAKLVRKKQATKSQRRQKNLRRSLVYGMSSMEREDRSEKRQGESEATSR